MNHVVIKTGFINQYPSSLYKLHLPAKPQNVFCHTAVIMMFSKMVNGSSSSEYPLQVYEPKHIAVIKPKVSGVHAPIISSLNDRTRPLLDCVDKLRHLNIMQEGTQLPTIMAVRDQSFGKSSVIESLPGTSLPRGNDTCTRVPLITRLQGVQVEAPTYVEPCIQSL